MSQVRSDQSGISSLSAATAPAKLSPARCVHHWFEWQAAQQPDAFAVSDGKQKLTYRELNSAANRIAHELIAAGVLADDRVGLCIGRSVDLLAGLLGILKAGGAYVPLDPDYPAARLAHMKHKKRAHPQEACVFRGQMPRSPRRVAGRPPPPSRVSEARARAQHQINTLRRCCGWCPSTRSSRCLP